MKNTVRRPTEEAALAHIMRENKRAEKQAYHISVQRVVFNSDGSKWVIWVKPEFRLLSTEDFRRGWQARAPGMSFIGFLEKDGVIRRKEEAT